MGESQSDATQLAAVLGEEQEVVIVPGLAPDPNAVTVRPLKLKQFSDVLKCLGELGDVVTDNGFDAIKFLGSGDVAIRLLSIATGLPAAKLEQLELDEAALLAGTVWRVNKNFFEKKGDAILSALGIEKETADKLKTAASGLMRSNSSSPTDTDSTTSATTP